jgi:hypothetical protein
MEGVPDFDIGGGQKLVETEDINDDDLLQLLLKDELQNELGYSSLSPSLTDLTGSLPDPE